MAVLNQLRIPHMGSVENARVVAWHLAEGDRFNRGQLLYEVETDKTLTEITADADGILARRAAEEGDELKVGDLVGWWTAVDATPAVIADALAALDGKPAAASVPSAAASSQAAPARRDEDAATAPGYSPRVRALAREHGVDLARVRGSGPRGRVTAEDVLAAAASAEVASSAENASDIPAGYEGIPHVAHANSMRRRTIARRLAESARTAPHVTADMQIDMMSVLAARSRINALETGAGRPTVSLLSFLAAAVCRILPEHPELNATYLDTHTLHWSAINLGIAVDTDDGLIVPVLRDAGTLSLQELNTAIAGVAERARAGKSEAGELDGGTFTISNPGSLGPVLRAEAILNPPQVALLGLPAMRYAPVAVSDAAGGFRVEVRPLLRASLTFDHRALDGGQVIRFLNAVKQDLESTE